jgi:hypothetical protein
LETVVVLLNASFGGAIGTVALLVISFYLPERFPNYAIPAGYTIGFLQGAKQTHGVAVEQHLASRGRLGSWWAVVGISLLILVPVLVVLFGLAFVLPDVP